MRSLGLKIINIQPGKSGTHEEQIIYCLEKLQERLHDLNLGVDQLLKISVFFHPDITKEFLSQRKKIQKNFKDYLGDQNPGFSVISDFPGSGYDISIEAYLYTNTADYTMERKTLKGHRYTVLSTEHKKELYVAGITMEDYDENNTDMSEHVEYAFSTASKILESEGMSFNNITRIWNYLENITRTHQKDSGIYQNYQVFNDVRTSYYNQCHFENGYPSSTGIGMYKGGVVTEFIAVSTSEEVQVIPIKNNLQTDAYLYSGNVLIGCPHNGVPQISTPKFERAKLIVEDSAQILFVSGTASIINEKTIAPGNIVEQTITTLKLIDSLLQRQSDGFSEEERYFRVYVKQREHLSIVKSICEIRLANDFGQYLVADICRADLLVEIECICIKN